MKKTLLLFAAVMAATSLSAQYLVEQKGYNTLDANGNKIEEPVYETSTCYYYDGNNKMTIETSAYGYYRYTYNENGTVATKETWNTSGVFYKSQIATYKYDTQGNNTEITLQYLDQAGEVTSTGGQLFEEFENGHYKVMKNTNAEGEATYEVHYELTFNENKQLVSRIQMNKNYSTGEFDSKGLGEFYTYDANNYLIEMTQAYYNPNLGEGQEWSTIQGKTTYTYENGMTKTKTEWGSSRYGVTEKEWRYVYAALDASLIPANVKAEALKGNLVKVTWDAVAGATTYVVMYDNNVVEVETTEYTTPMLLDGEHQVAVLAVVNGEKKNISDFTVVSVKDEGNLPMQNFQILGAKKVDYDNNGYVSTYYELNMKWDVPAEASDITEYKVYVDFGSSYNASTGYTYGLTAEEKTGVYNNVNAWETKQGFWWTNFENTEYDPDTYQNVSLGSGPDCKVWICAVYATGESAPSNVVEVNIYDLAQKASSVDMVDADNNEEVEMYNLAGQRIYTTDATPQIYIIKQGGMVKKVMK